MEGDEPFAGHGNLMLGLRDDARDSCLHYEDLKRGGFEPSGDIAECSVLKAFQLVKSGRDQPWLSGWGSVVDNAEVNSPIDLEGSVFPEAPHFRGK